MRKRITSFALALVMLLSLMPSQAFAASTATLDIQTVEAKAGDTVQIPVTVSGLSDVYVCNFYGSFTLAEGLTLVSVTAGSNLASFTNGVSNLGVFQYDSNDAMSGATIADGTVFTLEVKVNDDATAGTYAVGMNIGTFADVDLEDISYTVNTGGVTIADDAVADGYTAGLSTTSNNEVESNGTVTVNVGVSHSDDNVFNAGEIKLGYDSNKLTLDETSLGDLKYTNENGVLTIEDFGDDKAMAYTYAIQFTAAEVTEDTKTTVTLTNAAFVHKDDADTRDLINATLNPASVEITIKVATVDVTLKNNDGSSTETETTNKGEEYTFAPDDADNYDYTDVTATVDGTDVEIKDNGDGTFTIAAENVTGDIEITYTKTAKSYKVTWEGTGADKVNDKADTATYGTDFEFTLPDDVDAGEDIGYAYELTSVTIGGKAYTGYIVKEGTREYTIPGTDITGDIVITITETELAANIFTVTVDGNGAGNAAVGSATVALNGTATITLTAETGYTYTVTATMGGATATVVESGDTYSVENVTGNVVFTVTKTLSGTVEVTEYITLNNIGTMYLVTYDGNFDTGKVPAYKGDTMYWSDKYDAYCYLVIADTLSADDAEAKIGAQTGTATGVNYSMNINGVSTVIDAADAQLVWNMYNALYSDFNSVTMARFLAADQNADKKVDTTDATTIITAILAGNAQ